MVMDLGQMRILPVPDHHRVMSVMIGPVTTFSHDLNLQFKPGTMPLLNKKLCWVRSTLMTAASLPGTTLEAKSAPKVTKGTAVAQTLARICYHHVRLRIRL